MSEAASFTDGYAYSIVEPMIAIWQVMSKMPGTCKVRWRKYSDNRTLLHFIRQIAFIAGYTDGGAPYGLTWEEVGIDPELPFDEKVLRYQAGEFSEGQDTFNEYEGLFD